MGDAMRGFQRFYLYTSAVAIVLVVGGCGRTSSPLMPITPAGSSDPVLPTHAIRRLGSLHYLPRFPTDRLEYSANGQYLATAAFAEVGTVPTGIQIWERATGSDKTPTQLRDIDITGFAWSPKGERIAVLHRSGGVVFWTPQQNLQMATVMADERFFAIAWSPRGDLLALRGDRLIYVIREAGYVVYKLPFTGQERSFPTTQMMSFSPDGKRLAVVAKEGIAVYDTHYGRLTTTLSDGAESVNFVRFLPSGDRIALGTNKGVRIVNLDASLPVTVLGETLCAGLACSPDGQYLATSGMSGFGESAIWNINTGQRVKLISNSSQAGIAFAPDNSELALGSRRTSFLKASTWDPIAVGDDQAYRLITGHLAGNRLWTGEIGPTVREWKWETGERGRSLSRTEGTTIAIAAIGEEHLAVAGETSTIDVFDLNTQRVAYTLPGHASVTNSLGYSLPHHRLISGGTDGVVRGWDLNSKSMRFEIPFVSNTNPGTRTEIAVAPNGDHFACGNPVNGEIQVFRVQDGESLWSKSMHPHGSIFMPIQFTPDSEQVATIVVVPDSKQPGRITLSVAILDSETGRERSRIDCGSHFISSIAFSPDTQLMALCAMKDETKSVQIWSVVSQKHVATLSGHLDWPRWLRLNDDGTKLISLSQDTTGIVWDVKYILRPASR